MSRVVVVRDELGEHERDESDFPLSIGRAASADVRLPGRGFDEPVAFLGIHEGVPFVQPADSGVPVFCNERLVDAARWLEDGDTLRIETARISCNLAGERIEFRVSDGAPPAREGPVIVIPPPVAQRQATTEEALPEIGPTRRQRARPSAAVWLACAAAMGLLAFGGFLLSAVAIEIEVDPAAETLELEGAWLSIAIGGQILVRPGNYEVVATLPGYYDARQPIRVTGEDNQHFPIRLRLLPGLLTVTTGDLMGGSVSADGQLLGAVPLADAELEAGVHSLLIEADRHLPEAVEIAIEGGGVAQQIDVALTPAWSPIRFVSQPSGASLSVDGQIVGTTPLDVDLLAGERELEIALPDHESRHATLQVLPNQALETREVILALADATLRLESQPTGASVTVDGRFRGRTPIDVPVAPGTLHRVELFKNGYARSVREVRFEAGETRELNLSLPARRGEVRVSSDPPDAELFVDGAPRGSANQTLMLSAVLHTIEVRKAGHASFRAQVTPSPGLPETVHARLATLENARVEKLAPIITTGSGQQLRLIQPGDFEMGAARRDQGRRSNEVQRRVVLTRPYYLATKEVTNEQFQRFFPRHSSGLFDRFSLDEDEQPIVRVSWEDAARYCNWLSSADGLPPAYVDRGGRISLVTPANTGYRLPTEAEWVFAARYAGGATRRKYPWGEALPPTEGSGNYADVSARELLPNVIPGYRDEFPVSAAVGSFLPNELGLYDLGGNVAEWVHDFYVVGASSESVETDPTGPATGRLHVVRGSSWQDSSITELRWSYRDQSADARSDVGFRIARYAE